MKISHIILPLAILFTSTVHAAWTVDASTDPITDEVTGTALSSVSDDRYTRTVVARCTTDSTNILIAFGEFMDNDPIGITYRIDKNEPITDIHGNSTDGSAAFLHTMNPEDRFALDELIRQMKKGNTLNIRGLNYRGTPSSFAISLSGFTKAFNAACPSYKTPKKTTAENVIDEINSVSFADVRADMTGHNIRSCDGIFTPNGFLADKCSLNEHPDRYGPYKKEAEAARKQFEQVINSRFPDVKDRLEGETTYSVFLSDWDDPIYAGRLESSFEASETEPCGSQFLTVYVNSSIVDKNSARYKAHELICK